MKELSGKQIVNVYYNVKKSVAVSPAYSSDSSPHYCLMVVLTL